MIAKSGEVLNVHSTLRETFIMCYFNIGERLLQNLEGRNICIIITLGFDNRLLVMAVFHVVNQNLNGFKDTRTVSFVCDDSAGEGWDVE